MKAILVAPIILLLSACKLGVIVPSGGTVGSQSVDYRCPEGSYCEFGIGSEFSESFTASPKPGFVFVEWQDGSRFLCADSTDQTCTVSLSGNALSQAIAASFEILYIMPIFKDVGFDTDGDGEYDRQDEDDDNDGLLDVDDQCPLVAGDGTPSGCRTFTRTLIANGKEWAQLISLANPSWSQLNDACPEGVCLDGRVITNGGRDTAYDVTGWKLASADEVKELFNSYIGSPVLGPVVDYYEEASSAWVPSFFSEGAGSLFNETWQGEWEYNWVTINSSLTAFTGLGITGWTSTPDVCATIERDEGVDKISFISVGSCRRTGFFGTGSGAWFYR